jgi:hypothetical protein
MIRAAQVRAARKRYLDMTPVLDEQSRRRFVALEAQALGQRNNAACCDGHHKNSVLLLKPLELLKAAQDRLQGYYLLGISYLFDLLIQTRRAGL